jgi:hypothetical protein
MRLSVIISGAILMAGQEFAPAAANELVSIETNFVASAELSLRHLNDVVKLANLCGIDRVSGVSTERRLDGVSVLVRGDENVEGRRVKYKMLVIRRDGWPGGERKGLDLKSAGEFWTGSQPIPEERTIVKVGNHTVRVALLNGIKPAGADKIIESFLLGRVRFASDSLKDALSRVDVTQASWTGISNGKLWITFSSPHTRFIFTQEGDEVRLLDKVQVYE